jgi:NADH-quinone oxidoreductase subunit N
MALMSSAVELVLIFIALEISSISSYVLAGFRRHEAASAEASLKYFLLGSFATAFFLYGVALMFGATGSTNIDPDQPERYGPLRVPLLAFVAVALMFVGLGFQSGGGAVPRMDAGRVRRSAGADCGVDVDGAEGRGVCSLVARGFRDQRAGNQSGSVWVAAALSMTLGNVGALVQNNVKRLLAYSSIAHAGYLAGGFRGRAGPREFRQPCSTPQPTLL